MATQQLSRYSLIAILVFSSLTLAGCAVIGGIFKAGVWVGVLAVVIVIAVVGVIVATVRG